LAKKTGVGAGRSAGLLRGHGRFEFMLSLITSRKFIPDKGAKRRLKYQYCQPNLLCQTGR